MKSSRTLGKNNPRLGRRLWIALLILCAIGAAAAAHRVVALGTAPGAGSSDSGARDAHFAAKAGMTLVHIVPSLLFVLLVPLQFVSSLRRRYRRFHRWTGRLIMGLGLAIGISALWLSAHPRRRRRRGDGDDVLRLPVPSLPRQGMVAHSKWANRTSP